MTEADSHNPAPAEPSEAADNTTPAWKPPYVAYTTLVSFVDNKLGANPLPPRVDRGFLDNYAGSVQAMLLATLRTMDLVGPQGEVTPALREATRSIGVRKAVFRRWALTFYKEQQDLAQQNATAQMLHETFTKRGVSGSTMRKAVVFYLALVDETGMDKSPHFKAPRQTGGSPVKARKKIEPTVAAQNPVAPSAVASAETLEIKLGDAGTVSVSVDVRWLQLPVDQFMELRSVLSKLEALGQPHDHVSLADGAVDGANGSE